jgi:hypothetical protein
MALFGIKYHILVMDLTGYSASQAAAAAPRCAVTGNQIQNYGFFATPDEQAALPTCLFVNKQKLDPGVLRHF